MKGVEPFLQQALEKVEKLREAEQQRGKALEATIDTHRGDQHRRRQADPSEVVSPQAQRGQGEPSQMTSARLPEGFAAGLDSPCCVSVHMLQKSFQVWQQYGWSGLDMQEGEGALGSLSYVCASCISSCGTVFSGHRPGTAPCARM